MQAEEVRFEYLPYPRRRHEDDRKVHIYVGTLCVDSVVLSLGMGHRTGRAVAIRAGSESLIRTCVIEALTQLPSKADGTPRQPREAPAIKPIDRELAMRFQGIRLDTLHLVDLAYPRKPHPSMRKVRVYADFDTQARVDITYEAHKATRIGRWWQNRKDDPLVLDDRRNESTVLIDTLSKIILSL